MTTRICDLVLRAVLAVYAVVGDWTRRWRIRWLVAELHKVHDIGAARDEVLNLVAELRADLAEHTEVHQFRGTCSKTEAGATRFGNLAREGWRNTQLGTTPNKVPF